MLDDENSKVPSLGPKEAYVVQHSVSRRHDFQFNRPVLNQTWKAMSHTEKAKVGRDVAAAKEVMI